MIELIDFSKKYRKSVIIHSTNIILEDKKFYFILGKNGVGKTTLLKCLLKLESYDGTIKYANLERQGIFPIFDDIPLYLNLNGYDNIKLLTGQAFNKEDINNLQILPHHLLKKKVKFYSLGEKKKLLMMAVIIKQPSCLILDEIANGLDQDSLKWFITRINMLKKNCLIIATGHYFEFYERILDEIIIIHDKKILQLVRGKENLHEIYEKYCRDD